MSDNPERLSYHANDAPPPVNNHDWYVKAVLVELRLIRMALQKLAPAKFDQPVETKAKK